MVAHNASSDALAEKSVCILNDWETEAGAASDPQTPYTGTHMEPLDNLLSFVKLIKTLKYFIHSFMEKRSSV